MTQEDKQYLKEKILKSPEYKAAKICFQNGCCKAYDLEEMAHYMFLCGMEFQRTGEMPKLME